MLKNKPNYEKIIEDFKNMRSGRIRRQIYNVLKLIPIEEKEQNIIEIGVATGKFTSMLSKYNHIYAVDLLLENILRAKKIVSELGNPNNATYINADCTTIPFKNDFFDKALAIDITEHLNDKQFKFLCQEAYRILKPGGRLYIYTPNLLHPFELSRPFRPVLRKEHIGVRSMTMLTKTLKSSNFNIKKNYFSNFFRRISIEAYKSA